MALAYASRFLVALIAIQLRTLSLDEGPNASTKTLQALTFSLPSVHHKTTRIRVGRVHRRIEPPVSNNPVPCGRKQLAAVVIAEFQAIRETTHSNLHIPQRIKKKKLPPNITAVP